jgi:signal transduction histidine kinase
MKIRTRSRLILVITLVIFLIVLSYVTQSVILTSFRQVEEQETTAHVQRYVSQLNNEIEDVANTCRDWSVRDETTKVFSETARGPDPVSVFPPQIMKNLGIDYLLVYDNAGKLIVSETITRDGETTRTIPSGLDGIVRNSILPEGMPGGVAGRRGFSTIDSDPIILAGYPVNYGNQSDALTGTLVMGRLLDKERIDGLDQTLQVDGTLEPISTDDNNNALLTADDMTRAKAGAIIIHPASEDQLEGFAIITGIENDPSFHLLRIETNRPVNQQVRQSILIVAAAIVILSIIFLLVVQLLTQRFVLAPLSRLDAGMRSISESGDLSLRMPETGDDEILSLSRAFNRMLGQIQQQRDEMHEFLEEISQQRDDLADARQELASRNRDLEELNRKADLYLDIYLDAITYEILNAIMGLRGYAELSRDAVPESERVFLDKIVALAQKSNDVIRNIETISRIYKNPPEICDLPLAPIVMKEIDSRSSAHIHMESCDRMVRANEMLGVVFDNLFSNSQKFGGQDAEITVTARDTPDGMIEITVADNGPGIADDMKPLIFDRFAKDTRERSSYGLGLHIVKMLVESYGGRVWADDRIPGNRQAGAAIRFTLHPAGK